MIWLDCRASPKSNRAGAGFVAGENRIDFFIRKQPPYLGACINQILPGARTRWFRGRFFIEGIERLVSSSSASCKWRVSISARTRFTRLGLISRSMVKPSCFKVIVTRHLYAAFYGVANLTHSENGNRCCLPPSKSLASTSMRLALGS